MIMKMCDNQKIPQEHAYPLKFFDTTQIDDVDGRRRRLRDESFDIGAVEKCRINRI